MTTTMIVIMMEIDTKYSSVLQVPCTVRSSLAERCATLIHQHRWRARTRVAVSAATSSVIEDCCVDGDVALDHEKLCHRLQAASQ